MSVTLNAVLVADGANSAIIQATGYIDALTSQRLVNNSATARDSLLLSPARDGDDGNCTLITSST